MKKTLTATILMFALMLVSISVFAQAVFLPTDPEVESLRSLYSQARLSLPETSFPVSRRDLQRRALELMESPRAGAYVEEIEAYLDRLGFNDRDIVVQTEVDLAFQLFTYNIAITNYPHGELHEKMRDLEPLLALKLGYAHDDVGSLYIRADVVAEYNREGYTNLPPSTSNRPVAAEYNFVREGYIQYFVGPMETIFGRQPVHIGPAPTTSLIVSHEIPFLDAFRVKLPFGPLTMTMIWATMENRQTLEEARAIASEALPWPDHENRRDFYDWQRNIILLSIHRFEWGFGRVRAGIGARTIIVREMNEFHFGDLFPVFSRHNGNIVPNNMSLVGDVSFAAAPGLETYLLFGLDDMDAGAIGYGDDDIPTIGAYAIGAVYRRRFGEHRFTGDVELGTTHDLWGNFDIPDSDERLSRAIYRLDTSGTPRAMPLTSPYGPGVIWATLGGRVDTPFGLTAGLRLRFLNRNTEVDVYSTPYTGAAKDGQHEDSFATEVDLRYQLADRTFVSASPSVLFASGSADWRLTLGVATAIGGRRAVSTYSQ